MDWVLLNVTVKQRHVDAGDNGAFTHPLSLAIREAMQQTIPFQGRGLGAVEIYFLGYRENGVAECGVTIQVGTAQHWHLYTCDDMPQSATEFIEKFGRESVEPFSFNADAHGYAI